ncbi:TPA: J domain-containing protein [Streptococcus suis]
MSDIIPFVPHDDLQKDIERLRIEISMKFLERDDLILQQCPSIETAYLLRFGSLEYKVIEAEYKWRRLRRKLQFLISARNRQEKIEEEQIEEWLDREFQEYLDRLDDKLKEMNEALDWSKRELLTKEESKLLKKLYRKIVKLLHPDLNPNLSDAQRDLFFKAVEAYEEGNIAKLEFIYTMIENQGEMKVSGLSLLQEKQRLENILIELQSSIEAIKDSYPYNLKTLLADEDACIEREQKLERQLESLVNEIRRCEEQIAQYV